MSWTYTCASYESIYIGLDQGSNGAMAQAWRTEQAYRDLTLETSTIITISHCISLVFNHHACPDFYI